jgi:hypothetical protein
VCLNSTNQLTVKGTATDESGIKEVGYDIYQNGVKQTPSPDPLLFTTNSKTESWTFNIQNIPAGKSQIVVYAIDNADKKTSGSGNISFDVFTTCGNLLAFSGFTAGQSIPNSGCIIQWTADATISSVDLLYTLDGGTTWTIIGQDISANTASILWSYMVDNVSNAFKLKIRDHDKPDLIFTESPTMKLTGDLIKPEANSVAYELQTITIKWPRLWGASGAAETVDIYRNLDGVETLLKSGVANSGDLTWQWEIPQFTHSENAKIKIVSSTDPTLYSVSGAFKIFRNNFLRKYYLDLLY